MGIRNRRHRQQISAHLESLDAGLDAEAAPRAALRQAATLCVEGNISTGKTTFLRMLDQGLQSLGHTIQVPHPLPPGGLDP